MRSPTLLAMKLFAAALLLASCQLLTGGEGAVDEQDAGSTTSPIGACNLACMQGTHCEVQSQGPVCVPPSAPPSVPPAVQPVDAAVTPPPVVPPAGACNLACIMGSHCAVQAQGPACVPDPIGAIDAGPPAQVCNLLCVVGRHCKLTAQGPSCVLDKPKPVIDAALPIPDETPCGETTCTADEMCCSASCGICEPKGGLCPAIDCAPDAAVPTVPDAEVPKETCAVALCPADTYCDDITGSVECKPLPSCNTVKCMANTTCELVQVQCIRAPCPPQPQCVAIPPQGCNLACKGGSHCVMSSSGPVCEFEPGGVSCGRRTCYGGQTCCNASCGLCAGPGSACIQVACNPVETDVNVPF